MSLTAEERKLVHDIAGKVHLLILYLSDSPEAEQIGADCKAIVNKLLRRANGLTMNDNLILGMAVSVILNVLKNPQEKGKLKAVMLKIYRSIQLVYGDDRDFRS